MKTKHTQEFFSIILVYVLYTFFRFQSILFKKRPFGIHEPQNGSYNAFLKFERFGPGYSYNMYSKLK